MAGVRTTHSDYDDLLPVWRRCGDVVKGQRAIHSGKENYLPKNGAESDDDYAARLKRSDFFNATWRSIAGLTGLAFRKDPVMSLPTAIEPYADDIDLAGTTLYNLAKASCEEVLELGRVGLLVDHPPAPENITAISQAIADRMGLRPSIKTYDAKCIINWRYSRIGNATILTRVVLKEQVKIDADEFSQDTEDRYRVLDIDESGQYRQRVFKIEDDKDVLIEGPIYPVMRGKTLNFIPFKIVGANGMATDTDEPPLIDLVDANIAHYQVNSDIRVAMHFGVPTFVISGMSEDEGEGGIVIGSRSAILLRDPTAKAYFAEPEGQMLPQMQAALKEIEQRMAILGARMIADETRQAETLGATVIKRSGENSVMAAIVIGVSDAIRWALEIMAEWAGASGEVVFQINKEFTPTGMTAQDLTAYMSAVQQGLMSEIEFYELLQRGDVVDGEKDYETHQEEIAATPQLAALDRGSIAA